MSLTRYHYAEDHKCNIFSSFLEEILTPVSVDVALKRGFSIYLLRNTLFCSSFQNINMFHLQEKEEIFDKAYIN